MPKLTPLTLVLVFISALVVAGVGYALLNTSNGETQQETSIPSEAPIEATDTQPSLDSSFVLKFFEPPDLNKEVELILSIEVPDAYENVSVDFELPNNFQVLSGETQWTGAVSLNERKTLKLLVKAMTLGDSVVSARIKGEGSTVYPCEKSVALFVSVKETNTAVRDIVVSETAIEAHQGPFPLVTDDAPPPLSPEEKKRLEEALEKTYLPGPPLSGSPDSSLTPLPPPSEPHEALLRKIPVDRNPCA